MAVHSWRCWRCGGWGRVWRGFFETGPAPKYHPRCRNEAACADRLSRAKAAGRSISDEQQKDAERVHVLALGEEPEDHAGEDFEAADVQAQEPEQDLQPRRRRRGVRRVPRVLTAEGVFCLGCRPDELLAQAAAQDEEVCSACGA